MKRINIFAAAVLVSLFSGCASVQYAEKPANITVQPDKGLVYVYRESSIVGAAISFDVKEGDTAVGTLANGSFFILNAAPGAHTYTAKTESTTSLDLKVEAGKTYYVRGGLSMGLVAGRPNLSVVTEAEAKKAKIDKLKYTDITAVKAPAKSNKSSKAKK